MAKFSQLDFGKLNAALQLPVRLRDSPKTPVCFLPMFTGAQPEVHGIRRYERPVLGLRYTVRCFGPGNKRVAIAAVRDSSIDLIFGRNLDYFSETYDAEVLERTLELVEKTSMTSSSRYQQEYDDTLRKTTPLSDACIRAARNHVDAFAVLAGAFIVVGPLSPRVVFAPDHGTLTRLRVTAITARTFPKTCIFSIAMGWTARERHYGT